MKSTVAALCFLTVVACCTAMLLEEQCRAPRPFASCGSNVSLRIFYYFSNYTNQCERSFGCDMGMNTFEDKLCCATECPYGNHHPPGKQGS
uniref:Putative tick kunitz 38 n=1 Tax=Ixodes ricinus TaxID=34613 RepID=V5HDE8_IXORI